MTRLQALQVRCQRYPYDRLAKRLTPMEYALMVKFIADNDLLDRGAFELKLNRMFLNLPEKPKHWTIIADLLMIANSAAGN